MGLPAAPGLSRTRWMLTNPLVSDWPKPVQNCAGVWSCNRWMVGGASRPETCLRLDSLLPSLSAASRRFDSTGGKSETCVMRCASIRRTASSAS